MNVSDYARRYVLKNPWVIHYRCARARCLYDKNSQYYMKIKIYMKTADFKKLWFRDKAYEMIRPSIDRINNNGDYEINNCRYIELEENKRKSPRIVGQAHPLSKLTNDKVISIRSEYMSGKTSNYKLGKKYGVCHQTINKVVNLKAWKHV